MDGESSSLISALICTLAKPGSNSLTVILVVMLTSYALKNHCNLVYICNPPSFILNTIHVYAFTSIAFREVFNLFDINGGGTIDADELDAALKTVDINLTYKEIQDVLHVIDEDGKSSLYIYSQPLSFQNVSQVLALLLACFQLSIKVPKATNQLLTYFLFHTGNGEIDFEEFLTLMTSTEKYLEGLRGKLICRNDCTNHAAYSMYTVQLLFDLCMFPNYRWAQR